MVDMDTLVSLCKRRGFIFQSSEIYGGFGSAWDYGPLGVELKRNIKEVWWRDLVQKREDIVGLDASILMSPQVWIASGHVEKFTDPLVDCKSCQRRFRADEVGDRCPECDGELTEARQFNTMFKTFVGPVEDEASVAYLRPETAQGIFVNFPNVRSATRRKLPFGIAQIGKAFRNEITPGNFTFRTREFEQMEIEYFVKPGADEEWFEYWVKERLEWYKRYGIREENLRLREHGPEELSHYSKATYDIEYNFPFGWSELEGIANRTDFDLRQHAEFSGKDMTYFDEETGEHIYPYVIEPSGGIDRAALAFLVDAYHEEEVRGRKRVLLRLHHDLAPVKVAVLPLLRNRPEVVALAKEIARDLRPHFVVMYDDTASIGRLYRRQDEVGTPYCVTVDVQSLEDKAVTVRERDSMEQARPPIAELKGFLLEKLKVC
ncbi:MAG TPA: glycine--tRNA ligase [Chloroflexi bacterium]|nr:glycine--tRNA ligase [Chloroflexota bacterium]